MNRKTFLQYGTERGRGIAEVEKHGKRRRGEHKGWSSTPAGTRDKILKATREQADVTVISDRAGSASCFLLCQLQPLADPSIQLLSPKNMCLGKATPQVPGEPLMCSFESMEHYRREVIMPHSIKTRGCKHNCLYFLELQGVIHTKQW